MIMQAAHHPLGSPDSKKCKIRSGGHLERVPLNWKIILSKTQFIWKVISVGLLWVQNHFSILFVSWDLIRTIWGSRWKNHISVYFVWLVELFCRLVSTVGQSWGWSLEIVGNRRHFLGCYLCLERIELKRTGKIKLSLCSLFCNLFFKNSEQFCCIAYSYS